MQRRKPGFINDFFDDNLWWALAWVAAGDLTGDERYRAAAQAIFAHSLSGWDNACGGGLWWNEKLDYKNAITNGFSSPSPRCSPPGCPACRSTGTGRCASGSGCSAAG